MVFLGSVYFYGDSSCVSAKRGIVSARPPLFFESGTAERKLTEQAGQFVFERISQRDGFHLREMMVTGIVGKFTFPESCDLASHCRVPPLGCGLKLLSRPRQGEAAYGA